MLAGAVGGDVDGADRAGEPGTSAAEDVEIAALEVVVIETHETSPSLQISDVDAVAVGIIQFQADLGVCSSLDDRSRPNVRS